MSTGLLRFQTHSQKPPVPVVAILLALAAVSLIYATVGQAGGTGFLAIMALGGMPAAELRPTALILNIVAASYSTWHLHVTRAIDWRLVARVAIPALPASFLGGLVALDSGVYCALTGIILLLAAAMMVITLRAVAVVPPGPVSAGVVGGVAGFVSGMTGVGGGVFLAPAMIGLSWVTARQAACLSAPFILGNSISGLAGAIAAGQRPSDDVALYAVAAVAGAVIGTMIGQRFMGERATRYVLAAVLIVAGVRLLSR